MLKFTDFLNEVAGTGQTNLSQEVRQPAPVTPTPASPTPATPKGKLLDAVRTFIDKRKTSPTPKPTNQQQDVLTLKIRNFRDGQDIDIKLEQNIEIKAQVMSVPMVNKAGKQYKLKYCQLLKSNIEEISLHKPEAPASTKIIDVHDQPLAAPPRTIYFRSFLEKGQTWFYFYDNLDNLKNQGKPIFSKIYKVISAG